jgi:hypothetical protein
VIVFFGFFCWFILAGGEKKDRVTVFSRKTQENCLPLY